MNKGDFSSKRSNKIPSFKKERSNAGSLTNSPKKARGQKSKQNGLVSFKNEESFSNKLTIVRDSSPMKTYDKDTITLQTPYEDDDFQIHFNK